MSLLKGPQPIPRSQRREKALEIAERFRQHYGERVLALGVYGSVARGEDGPYSDIEMHCVLREPGVDECFEWSAGDWKAEVDVISQEILLKKAHQVDVDWPITHGAFTRVWSLYDPDGFFPRLAQTAVSQSESIFKELLQEVIVGEIYELIGKIRNAAEFKEYSSLPTIAVDLASDAACLVGIAQRHIYTSSAYIYRESLSLPDLPTGYEALAELVMQGRLDDPHQIISLANALWEGIEQWAERKHLVITNEMPFGG